MRALMLLACPLALVACVHVAHYPKSWEAISPDARPTNCADIAATYQNKGENEDGREVLLATWLDPTLNQWNTPERTRVEHQLASAQRIELTLTHVALQVAAIGAGTRRQWSYRYACRRGKVHIPRQGDMSGDNVALIGSDAIDLYRAKSHLVVNRHGAWVGVAMLIPVSGYDSTWARFPLKENTEPDAPQ
jgi:hypothetical protein